MGVGFEMTPAECIEQGIDIGVMHPIKSGGKDAILYNLDWKER
jgi:hypothetical protein